MLETAINPNAHGTSGALVTISYIIGMAKRAKATGPPA
jgi:hypothetical protein